MSSDNRSERERLKEEYKAHYRKMRATKERLEQTRKKQNIVQALKNMDKSELLDSFDNFLYSVKHKLASVEARLDIAMNNLADMEGQGTSEQQLDEEMKQTKARETLRQVKTEMGLLYQEIEQQAGSIHVEKTIGSGEEESSPDKPASPTRSERTKEER
ncbi:hypothetical protein [Fodinibius sediminis]|uniref:Uncharacterized protein n=1 Tax=Fodinibius sediminis TaxID=1214077 RepID=A0A521E015_9BACT|nr:hypothetical protein [Fodinibius sediminis]SMO77268.1 hypothetical protein SAMN06265218_112106 [Fodinibius sediminis]